MNLRSFNRESILVGDSFSLKVTDISPLNRYYPTIVKLSGSFVLILSFRIACGILIDRTFPKNFVVFVRVTISTNFAATFADNLLSSFRGPKNGNHRWKGKLRLKIIEGIEEKKARESTVTRYPMNAKAVLKIPFIFAWFFLHRRQFIVRYDVWLHRGEKNVSRKNWNVILVSSCFASYRRK